MIEVIDEKIKVLLKSSGLDFSEREINYLKFKKNYLEQNAEGAEKYNSLIKGLKEIGLKERDIFTPSGGVSRFKFGFGVKRSKTGWEIVINGYYVAARIIFDNFSKAKRDRTEIGGFNSAMWLLKEFKKDGVDLKSYATDKGEEIKASIPSPLIMAGGFLKFNETYEHVHHLDVHSSYASGISATYPELKPTYERLYAKRLESPELKRSIKSLFTNSTGFFQSEHCTLGGYGQNRFTLANLSKAAIEWTRKFILQRTQELLKAGYYPLLFNTDGIWYAKFNKDGKAIESAPFENEFTGKGLGTFQNDHVDCKFRAKSKGAYEFIENGEYHSVVRGVPKEVQEKWTWGGIYSEQSAIVMYDENEDGTLKEITLKEINYELNKNRKN